MQGGEFQNANPSRCTKHNFNISAHAKSSHAYANKTQFYKTMRIHIINTQKQRSRLHATIFEKNGGWGV
jgi:hypothetical protein